MAARTSRILLALLTAAAAALGLGLAAPLSPVVAAAPESGVVAPVPTISWHRCPDFGHVLCAEVPVPLDYDDPTGPTLTLDLLKQPALDAAGRLGTLFVNPGGPGGSARDFAAYGADLLGDTVALHYDVIGIDPRGVGPHSRMVCKTSQPAPAQRYLFPVTVRQSRSVWRDGRYFNRACKESPSQVVAHMSTADTARDMDLVRQAIGEEQLNYYGVSYGTYLGAVYAAMFPDRVGRFVVDGVLDPVQWATGDATTSALPFTTRIDSAQGSHEALTSALAECDRMGRRSCALAPRAGTKWQQLVRRARADRLRYYGSTVTYQDLVGGTLGLLYDNYDYTYLALSLQDLYARNFAVGRPPRGRPVMSLAELRQRARDVIRAPYTPTALARRIVNAADPFLGVSCADSRNPRGRPTWWDAGRSQDRRSSWFGSLWTWTSAPCSGWLAAAHADAFTGPFEVTPANPVLVVGNSHDPATPVSGARRLTTLLKGSRFLLMDGWGHAALTNSCVTAAFDAYFASGALPPEGTVCPKDHPLYSGLEGSLRPFARWRPQAGG
ncbi:MAG TPA: alpha/beta fold hydrolase [Nocardioides sp.]|uniref:alpha/beta fold hydrolase n=1 Tax=Nocardioides sp. TaxID=35761 RepID=UPI002CA30DC8|nr:alpha/beta fold hydrolase [Nocardioides sp.]HQR27577.1 alpha/beta fold hydrolase [Nocardioides sp.]